ncbi:ExbD/TolR family protein [Jannaschia aquimarina]|uniref:Biopolymer transport protein ExbD/TolR n=1 Tax=Jannaschia aquimarina TaxID=935700 RepID=A0A0D1ELS5_9RHOB|nr:biopolymer transporter ExbD [Jannaschia aquimarina]KIT17911.1 Biopolymer transport protein ExbD/TolR [Jannaschia aquimarina]SNT23602.1 Biopolymer transport protein ExbD [Jannaschia aquimarina]
MQARSASIIPIRRRKGYRFALTPLADAMFQLLIFFMLSSSLAPYSLMTLKPGAASQRGAGESPAPAAPAGPPSAIWTVDAGAVIAGGQRFGFDALPRLSARMAAQDDGGVLLITRPAARVQDMVAVLEALSAANVPAVRLAPGLGS